MGAHRAPPLPAGPPGRASAVQGVVATARDAITCVMTTRNAIKHGPLTRVRQHHVGAEEDAGRVALGRAPGRRAREQAAHGPAHAARAQAPDAQPRLQAAQQRLRCAEGRVRTGRGRRRSGALQAIGRLRSRRCLRAADIEVPFKARVQSLPATTCAHLGGLEGCGRRDGSRQPLEPARRLGSSGGAHRRRRRRDGAQRRHGERGSGGGSRRAARRRRGRAPRGAARRAGRGRAVGGAVRRLRDALRRRGEAAVVPAGTGWRRCLVGPAHGRLSKGGSESPAQAASRAAACRTHHGRRTQPRRGTRSPPHGAGGAAAGVGRARGGGLCRGAARRGAGGLRLGAHLRLLQRHAAGHDGGRARDPGVSCLPALGCRVDGDLAGLPGCLAAPAARTHSAATARQHRRMHAHVNGTPVAAKARASARVVWRCSQNARHAACSLRLLLWRRSAARRVAWRGR